MARNPFWAWSLRFYKRPGVAPACLALQDRAGVDVNLLLFCLWSGGRRLALNRATMNKALHTSRDWSGSVVQPLRSVRRALEGPVQSSKMLQRFRRRVAALELEGERLQQDRLHALVRDMPPIRADAGALAAGNVATYFRCAGIRLAHRDQAALKTIALTAS
jgi:uncharacterized protein (TIGR02444 family)